MQEVKLSDVAKYANVSTATVSNVINATRPVSESMRKTVMDAMRELNYKPSRTVKTASSNVERTIAAIITSTQHIFFADVLAGVHRMAMKHGYNVAIYSSEESFDRERQLIHYLTEKKVDGILLNSKCGANDEAYFSKLAGLKKGKRRIPVVSFDRDFVSRGISSAYVDSYKGAKMATEYLIKRGCEKIGCISGGKLEEVTINRYNGYADALREAGMPVDESLVGRGDYTSITGYRVFKRMLINGIKPDGIFAFNDQMAIGAMKAANEYGLRCPEKIKIIGYDNIFVASVVMPQITTINVPRFRMGEEAFSLLYEEMNDPQCDKGEEHKAKGSEVISDLIIRQSTDPDAIFSTWDLDRW